MKNKINISREYLIYFRLMFFLWGSLQFAQLNAGENEVKRYQFESVQMGGPWTITLYAADELQGKDAALKAFKRVEEINNIFSDYSDKSELTQIISSYKAGQPVKVSAEFFHVTQQALKYAEISEGSFDITIGPLTQLWRRAYRKKQFPENIVWEAGLKKVGYQHLKLDPCQQTICFMQEGMKLDYGAIVKGYAADQALNVLRECGYKQALVDGNGNFAAGDAPQGKEFWTIEVLQLEKNSAVKESPMLIKLVNEGISTSGDYLQSIEIDSKNYSHIIDPLTGKPQQDKRLVTVVAEDAMTADILSTILCLKGKDFLEVILKKHPQIAVYGAVKIKDDLQIFGTENWGNKIKKEQ